MLQNYNLCFTNPSKNESQGLRKIKISEKYIFDVT